MRTFTCGVPRNECNGAEVQLTNSLKSTGIKVHGTSEQAFNCHVRYLLKQGYKRLGTREFTKDDDSPILILNKKSHFGGVFRQGKKEKTTNSGRRVMPKEFNGGIIASY